MAYTSIAALALGALGVAGVVLGLVRLCRLRFANGCGHCLLGAALVGSGALVGTVGANLYTYDRLTQERDVLQIRFVQEDDQRYIAIVQYADSPVVERFPVLGDEWQVDARMLKWKGPATLVGMDSRYRLERLSGRYRDIDQERDAPRSVHSLGGDRGLDIWGLLRDRDQYVPWVDAVYGSATYLPMEDGARYRVRVSQTGLLARPADEDAPVVPSSWE
ncbi:cation/multidrug efflux pump [Aquisalimonas sp. 2447]|uniref:cation/multidrug efflux pump n=1 Tax=Aquisalimonas sp. 2447 TaxID=2740807 RepID=UPI001432774C|nr:cation/multidrug efflux pump [Aquisalimonas sp. 2447]QIT55400.1 cation/multidrug efflux pump [Aquisalimonas sp. 2447]